MGSETRRERKRGRERKKSIEDKWKRGVEIK